MQGEFHVPSAFPVARGRSRLGSNGHVHQMDMAGYGAKRPRKDCRDNVGKGHPQQGLTATCKDPPYAGNRSRWERNGLAHEPVGATKEEQRPPRRPVRSPWRKPGKGALDTRWFCLLTARAGL